MDWFLVVIVLEMFLGILIIKNCSKRTIYTLITTYLGNKRIGYKKLVEEHCLAEIWPEIDYGVSINYKVKIVGDNLKSIRRMQTKIKELIEA